MGQVAEQLDEACEDKACKDKARKDRASFSALISKHKPPSPQQPAFNRLKLPKILYNYRKRTVLLGVLTVGHTDDKHQQKVISKIVSGSASGTSNLSKLKKIFEPQYTSESIYFGIEKHFPLPTVEAISAKRTTSNLAKDTTIEALEH
ncbi:uncharacterized protein BDR25DRAFT_359989 [Lindgomyces ingoldianus]|uniref:Uncharacterized protein n=1 Tax=Lindgomyces ingoldianus TaxID=673940 RepID=A0ACB6QGZ3_9PLEO|nr:uncharacterized protein BDR25DRAFT_359989 [Lindgomyces ingoldianus]KAF2465833.1 hypothetical protein BDR25DRAFT_359989 [Lindgomyces ingoldianus]